MALRRWLGFLANPLNQGRSEALQRRWRELPEDLRTTDQSIGRWMPGCGATHGIHERCNFGCTACYLGKDANRQPPMPFAEVKRQLETLREHMGPGANVQITSGEVTLLPAADLIRILRTARDLELSPMVMTHGDVVLHDHAYLDRLVLEGGLRKISFHVDITQRGRKDVSHTNNEAELNPVRDRCAHLLRAVRARTGVTLKAATTMTVNQGNLDQLGGVVSWLTHNLDSFRILSLQPQARTGRTRDDDGVSADAVWQRLEQALGRSLNPRPFAFGHEACTRIAMLVAVETGREPIILEAVRADRQMDKNLVNAFMQDFAGMVINDKPLSEVVAKILGVVMRKPWWLVRLAVYGMGRSWQERRLAPRVLRALMGGKFRFRPFALVVHAFMDRDELTTDLGRDRVAACAFRVPVDGRMVSMCEMNGSGLRESTYEVGDEKAEPFLV